MTYFKNSEKHNDSKDVSNENDSGSFESLANQQDLDTGLQQAAKHKAVEVDPKNMKHGEDFCCGSCGG